MIIVLIDGINTTIQPALATVTMISRRKLFISKFVNHHQLKRLINIYILNPRQERYIVGGNKKHQEVQITSLEDCIKGIKLENGLQTEDGESLFCIKNKYYHVPQSCKVELGSPVFLKEFSDEHYQQTLIKGLVLATHDCTFTLALNISTYYTWINSIVFPSSSDE